MVQKVSIYRQFIISTIISLSIVIVFALWALLDAQSLHDLSYEDGPIESATGILFGLSGLCFIVFAIRSDFLKEKQRRSYYFFTLCWALLMLIFMGEEISWGQRIFGIASPEMINILNVQDETNIHNLSFFYKLGGEYRVISLIILTTGLFLPLFAVSNFGKRIIQKYAFPVSPIGYAILFIGAYSYARFFKGYFSYSNDASEVREFLWALGMFCYTIHGVISPCSLFRACKMEK